MIFIQVIHTEAISECGQYSRKLSRDPRSGAPYFNCWHIPSGKHVAAGFSAKEISDRCDEHKARQG